MSVRRTALITGASSGFGGCTQSSVVIVPIPGGMKVVASPEARSHIRERGGLLFVWVKRHGNIRGVLRLLHTSTEPPPDALEWQRVETKGFVLFLPPGLRRPRELHVEVRGFLRRRVEVFWEGCAFIL